MINRKELNVKEMEQVNGGIIPNDMGAADIPDWPVMAKLTEKAEFAGTENLMTTYATKVGDKEI